MKDMPASVYTDDVRGPPTKRVKIESSMLKEEEDTKVLPELAGDDFDDEDFYGGDTPVKLESPPPSYTSQSAASASVTTTAFAATSAPPSGIPGLSSFGDPLAALESAASIAPPMSTPQTPDSLPVVEASSTRELSGLPEAETLVSLDSLQHDNGEIEKFTKPELPTCEKRTPVEQAGVVKVEDEAAAAASASNPRQEEDPEFLEAAQANKVDGSAEWRYDTSDAESTSNSDSSSDSSDSSDSDSDEDVLLDPEEQARILMRANGDDESAPTKAALRTTNEKPEEILPIPDITVTSETKITELGNVETIIANHILIKAKVSGSYRVLDAGSPLCLQSRVLFGVVADILGRVQAPMYVVGFQNTEAIKEAGITTGTTVYYLNDHSTYVFTEALQAQKHTDASNVHDEEVGSEDIDFSDDEQEAEYKKYKKRMKQQEKEARNLARGTPSNRRGPRGGSRSFAPGPRPHGISNTSSQTAPYPSNLDYEDNSPRSGNSENVSYPTKLNYDDDDDEEMYKPLSRPDNLSAMMGSGPPPLEGRHSQYGPLHGYTRGRGNHETFRGRGDRGRGGHQSSRGKGDRQRTDRGRGNRGHDGRGRGSRSDHGRRSDDGRQGSHEYNGHLDDNQQSNIDSGRQHATLQSTMPGLLQPAVKNLPFPFSQVHAMPGFPSAAGDGTLALSNGSPQLPTGFPVIPNSSPSIPNFPVPNMSHGTRPVPGDGTGNGIPAAGYPTFDFDKAFEKFKTNFTQYQQQMGVQPPQQQQIYGGGWTAPPAPFQQQPVPIADLRLVSRQSSPPNVQLEELLRSINSGATGAPPPR